ncbi:MAG: hypothetical protein EBR28_03275 [Planctomycetia bacterium]|nr:hypothetical protein [Planctomycetia bacterium]
MRPPAWRSGRFRHRGATQAFRRRPVQDRSRRAPQRPDRRHRARRGRPGPHACRRPHRADQRCRGHRGRRGLALRPVGRRPRTHTKRSRR